MAVYCSKKLKNIYIYIYIKLVSLFSLKKQFLFSFFFLNPASLLSSFFLFIFFFSLPHLLSASPARDPIFPNPSRWDPSPQSPLPVCSIGSSSSLSIYSGFVSGDLSHPCRQPILPSPPSHRSPNADKPSPPSHRWSKLHC